ncbi:hypothetical protein HSIEG1_3598 [Enterococcus sp. HSIEG1]|nr:hypothetical protein HSIEG1_3598 [Enterococcus sp. HSIEG1]
MGHFSGLDLRHRINSPQHSLDHRNNVWYFLKKEKSRTIAVFEATPKS